MKRRYRPLSLGLFIIAIGLVSFRLATSATRASTSGSKYFVPHGAGERFSEKVEDVEVKLSSTQTDGRYTVQDEIWHPGFDVKPHYHNEHAETFYVMSGRIEWTVDGEKRDMTAGDIVFIPAKIVHSVHVVGAEDAHILFISQPGGFEHLEEKRKEYTEAQREDPKIRAMLREIGDAHFSETN